MPPKMHPLVFFRPTTTGNQQGNQPKRRMGREERKGKESKEGKEGRTGRGGRKGRKGTEEKEGKEGKEGEEGKERQERKERKIRGGGTEVTVRSERIIKKKVRLLMYFTTPEQSTKVGRRCNSGKTKKMIKTLFDVLAST